MDSRCCEGIVNKIREGKLNKKDWPKWLWPENQDNDYYVYIRNVWPLIIRKSREVAENLDLYDECRFYGEWHRNTYHKNINTPNPNYYTDTFLCAIIKKDLDATINNEKLPAGTTYREYAYNIIETVLTESCFNGFRVKYDKGFNPNEWKKPPKYKLVH